MTDGDCGRLLLYVVVKYRGYNKKGDSVLEIAFLVEMNGGPDHYQFEPHPKSQLI